MKKYIFLLAIFVLIIACKSQDNQNSEQPTADRPLVPAWLHEQIAEWEKEGYTSVEAYLFRQDTVYLAVPPCCDRFSELYDYSGDLICHPSGGITGKGDGKCPEFNDSSTLLKTLGTGTKNK